MKALVTGGGGFLGNALIYKLKQRGDEVRSFSRKEYASLKKINVEQIKGDIVDRDAVILAAKTCDIIFHIAAKVGSWGSYEEFYKTNVIGTENVIEACKACNIKHLIFTSTPSVIIGSSDLEGVDESIPYPDHYEAYYPKTKAEAERRIIAANSENLKTISLRPHIIYGPGDTSLLPRLLSRGRKGKLRKIRGPIKKSDITYIDDAVSAHLFAADKLVAGGALSEKIAGKVYFISSGEPVVIWEFINQILNIAKIPPVKKSISPKLAVSIALFFEIVYTLLNIKNEPPMTRWVVHELCTSHWFNISAAKSDLGFEPKVMLNDGLVRLERWLLDN